MIQEQTVQRMKPGHLMQHYLMASCAYYHWHLCPMTDAAFDLLCKRLKEVHPELVHQHKHLVTIEDLEAGTCLLREDQFPNIVRYQIHDYNLKCLSGEMAKMLEPYLDPVQKKELF